MSSTINLQIIKRILLRSNNIPDFDLESSSTNIVVVGEYIVISNGSSVIRIPLDRYISYTQSFYNIIKK